MIATAAAGIYPLDRFEKMPTPRRERYFERSREGTHLEAGSELKRLITFKRLNLIEPWPLKGPFDVIFCRNVMIYFDNPTQRRVLERIHGVLRSGGLLYVGHSENFTESRDLFRLRGTGAAPRA